MQGQVIAWSVRNKLERTCKEAAMVLFTVLLYTLWHIYCAYCWFIFFLYRYVIGETEENDENPEDKRPSSEDSKPGPPEYESGILPTRPSSFLLLSWSGSFNHAIWSVYAFFVDCRNEFDPACCNAVTSTTLQLKCCNVTSTSTTLATRAVVLWQVQVWPWDWHAVI